MFGTDGVRGVANATLTAELAYKLGQAAVVFLGPELVVGRDTRRSGVMLEAALVAGIASAGGTARLAGIIPTPAIALLDRELAADGGVVISASHNPPEYNGIKLFNGAGYKLPDATEDEIEAFVAAGGLEGAVARGERDGMPTGSALGTAVPIPDAAKRYIDHVVNAIRADGIDFTGLKIALDAAHGAAATTSLRAFTALGADVVAINEDYTGDDINVECGSTNLGALRELMAASGADVGVAHDGDADRVMLMAPNGDVIDGDVIEAICAIDLKARGRLAKDTIVTTVMCNLGLVRGMEAEGINVVQTKVGDRYVLERMLADSLSIGAEQSGHVILLESNTTGDGLMTACQCIAAVLRSGQTFDEAAATITHYPQMLINVRVADREAAMADPAVVAAVAEAEAALGANGRVLLRPSGTEPLIRVMVEAADEADAAHWANAIAESVPTE